jgi:hypothetical protein
VAGAPELGHKLLEIVDFAVEDDGNRTILVEHRLVAVRYVDDGKAPVSKPDAAFEVIARSIGSAMGDGIGHARKQRAIDRAWAGEIENACNSTHRDVLPLAGAL